MPIETLVRLFYRSIRVADVEGFVGLFAQDAAMHDPVGTPPYMGPQGAGSFLAGILGLCEQFDIAATEVIVREKTVAVTWEAFAIGKNGARVEFGGIDVFVISPENQIRTLHAFWDPTAVMPALTGTRGIAAEHETSS